MKKNSPKNLNEELNKIKRLMRFNVGDSSHYVLSEQVSVNSNIFDTVVGTFKLNDLPSAINNYDPSKGYIRISGGNEWLANSRAKTLKNFLINNVPSKIGVKIESGNVTITEAEVLGPGDKNQYVIGKMYGRIFKPPQKQEEYPFQVWYNFYELGGVPHIIVTKRGKGLVPYKYDGDRDFDSSYLRNVDKLGLNKFTVVKQKHPNTMNYAALVPITKDMGYVAWKDGILYFDDIEKYKDSVNFIGDLTDGEPTVSRDNKQTRFTSQAGGGGNYIIGTKDGLTSTIIYGKDKGKEINIKRFIQGKEGDIPGETKEGGESEWANLGDYKLDQNFFKDNMISLSPESYDKLFTDIRNIILQKYGEGFDIKTVELKSEIKGFASSDNATNRLPQGVEKPDHSYGNRVPADKWVKRG